MDDEDFSYFLPSGLDVLDSPKNNRNSSSSFNSNSFKPFDGVRSSNAGLNSTYTGKLNNSSTAAPPPGLASGGLFTSTPSSHNYPLINERMMGGGGVPNSRGGMTIGGRDDMMYSRGHITPSTSSLGGGASGSSAPPMGNLFSSSFHSSTPDTGTTSSSSSSYRPLPLSTSSGGYGYGTSRMNHPIAPGTTTSIPRTSPAALSSNYFYPPDSLQPDRSIKLASSSSDARIGGSNPSGSSSSSIFNNQSFTGINNSNVVNNRMDDLYNVNPSNIKRSSASWDISLESDISYKTDPFWLNNKSMNSSSLHPSSGYSIDNTDYLRNSLSSTKTTTPVGNNFVNNRASMKIEPSSSSSSSSSFHPIYGSTTSSSSVGLNPLPPGMGGTHASSSSVPLVTSSSSSTIGNKSIIETPPPNVVEKPTIEKHQHQQHHHPPPTEHYRQKKTIPCKKFPKCPHGDSCFFMHPNKQSDNLDNHEMLKENKFMRKSEGGVKKASSNIYESSSPIGLTSTTVSSVNVKTKPIKKVPIKKETKVVEVNTRVTTTTLVSPSEKLPSNDHHEGSFNSQALPVVTAFSSSSTSSHHVDSKQSNKVNGITSLSINPSSNIEHYYQEENVQIKENVEPRLSTEEFLLSQALKEINTMDQLSNILNNISNLETNLETTTSTTIPLTSTTPEPEGLIPFEVTPEVKKTQTRVISSSSTTSSSSNSSGEKNETTISHRNNENVVVMKKSSKSNQKTSSSLNPSVQMSKENIQLLDNDTLTSSSSLSSNKVSSNEVNPTTLKEKDSPSMNFRHSSKVSETTKVSSKNGSNNEGSSNDSPQAPQDLDVKGGGALNQSITVNPIDVVSKPFNAVSNFIDSHLSFLKEWNPLMYILSILSTFLSTFMLVVAAGMLFLVALTNLIYRLHKFAYTGLSSSHGDEPLMMVLIYVYPLFSKNMLPWVPICIPSLLWYWLMYHIFVLCGNDHKRVFIAQYLIPFLATLEVVAFQPNLVYQMNGGQLISLSFIVITLQSYNIQSPVFLLSFALQVFLVTAFNGNNGLLQWFLIVQNLMSFKTMAAISKAAAPQV